MKASENLCLFKDEFSENLNILSAHRHPKRYESHKYWGRKPFNIIREYISQYTHENDLILDPFCGSGSTLFEAVSLRRNSIGYDLNPIACFITKNLIERNIDTIKFKKVCEGIVDKIEAKFPYYDVLCECDNIGKFIIGIWKNSEYIEKYYRCPQCGNKMSPTTEFDKKNVADFHYPKDIWYPKDKLPENADAKFVYELFTKRNLLALGLLLSEIKKVREDSIRELLLYTFTANVAFTSIIIPVNEKRFKQRRNCTGIWGFKRFWIPGFHVENNVFIYFRNRLKRTVWAKEETNQLLKDSNAFGKVICKSSEKLEELNDKSVDYIFTDPPFGSMTPYLNLSTLWNSWLKLKPDFEKEIIIDDKNTEADYCKKIMAVFKECNRVLKNGKYLTVAFNNKSIKIWCTLLEAIHNAGFQMKECRPAEDGEVSFTQTTRSSKGSLRGHFVYVFEKKRTCKNNTIAPSNIKLELIKRKIEEEITRFIRYEGEKSITDIYNHIIPYMANNSLLSKDLKDNIIEQILKEKATLNIRTQKRVIEDELVELKSYFWKLN